MAKASKYHSKTSHLISTRFDFNLPGIVLTLQNTNSFVLLLMIKNLNTKTLIDCLPNAWPPIGYFDFGHDHEN